MERRMIRVIVDIKLEFITENEIILDTQEIEVD